MWIFFCIFVIMKIITTEKTIGEIDLKLYGDAWDGLTYPPDEETIENKWDRWHKRRLLLRSVRNLKKCGIEVDHNNRNKIIHNYE